VALLLGHEVPDRGQIDRIAGPRRRRDQAGSVAVLTGLETLDAADHRLMQPPAERPRLGPPGTTAGGFLKILKVLLEVHGETLCPRPPPAEGMAPNLHMISPAPSLIGSTTMTSVNRRRER
jgi:hypothetical protein